MTQREEHFEAMLAFVQTGYDSTVKKLEALKAENKTKTATYRQLLADKLSLQYVLNLYKTFDLIE